MTYDNSICQIFRQMITAFQLKTLTSNGLFLFQELYTKKLNQIEFNIHMSRILLGHRRSGTVLDFKVLYIGHCIVYIYRSSNLKFI